MKTRFPELETTRLVLRPMRPTDLAFVFEHFSNADVGKYLLDDDPVASVEQAKAIVYPENGASLKLLERHGFVREGLLREELCRGGVYYDHLLYSLLGREWRQGREVRADS